MFYLQGTSNLHLFVRIMRMNPTAVLDPINSSIDCPNSDFDNFKTVRLGNMPFFTAFMNIGICPELSSFIFKVVRLVHGRVNKLSSSTFSNIIGANGKRWQRWQQIISWWICWPKYNLHIIFVQLTMGTNWDQWVLAISSWTKEGVYHLICIPDLQKLKWVKLGRLPSWTALDKTTE